MENKKVIAICLLIGFICGFIVGVGYGATITINAVADKALSMGNFSEIVKNKIKERCLANWEGCIV